MTVTFGRRQPLVDLMNDDNGDLTITVDISSQLLLFMVIVLFVFN